MCKQQAAGSTFPGRKRAVIFLVSSQVAKVAKAFDLERKGLADQNENLLDLVSHLKALAGELSDDAPGNGSYQIKCDPQGMRPLRLATADVRRDSLSTAENHPPYESTRRYHKLQASRTLIACCVCSSYNCV